MNRKGFFTASRLRQLTVVLFISSILNAAATVLYVDLNNPTPVAPYTNWQTAAANIQDAVDGARRGDTVLVASGIYSTGSRASPDGTTNRVSVITPITLQSVKGSTATSIDGGGVMRCVYLCDGALLSGLTLTNGNATSASVPNGGGVGCASTNALVSNCILVNNIANSGGGAFSGTLTNCFLLQNTANGADAGGGAAGSTLYSCVLSGNVAHGSYGGGGAYACTLSNCVVTNNAADYGGGGVRGGTVYNCLISSNGAQYGGGAYDGALLYNCTLSGNSATYGGGEETSTLVNCLIISNTASSCGGGAYYGTLINCTVTGNTSSSGSGGGACSATVENSIVYYNLGGTIAWDDYACALTNSCTPTATGAGNTSNAPAFDSAYHLLAGSPCIDAGSNAFVTTTLDLAGNLRIINGRVDMGAFEYHFASPLTVSVQANYTNMVVGYPVQFSGALNGGRSACWTFTDGTVISNVLAVSHAWNAVGDYPVTFTVYDDNYPSGVSASVLIHVTAPPVMYVNPGCTNPVAPFSSWDTAATNIQDAIDTAGIGYHIVVTNGTYQSGGRIVFGSLANRVAINKPVVVQSVNGPSVTTIQGNRTLGDSAVRCVYLNSNAVLIGFTLSNGGTRTAGDGYQEQSGGALWCESTNALVSNCSVASSSANNSGGGVWQGTLTNCTITGCIATLGAGAAGCILNNCTLSANAVTEGNGMSYHLGGGAYSCTLNGCTLSGNSGCNGGGGACSSTLNSCILVNNSADMNNTFGGQWGVGGGGAYGCTLSNCTLTGNQTFWYGAAGAQNSGLNNSVISNNQGAIGGASRCTLSSCLISQNQGGGADHCSLTNCLVTGNSYGGVVDSTAVNCTIVGNNNVSAGGGATTGTGATTLLNCILYYNTSVFGAPNYDGITSLGDCCTTPLPSSGPGNITDQPIFVDLGSYDLRLQTNSPCIEAGNNVYVTSPNDLDGNPRIVGNNVDMGAYEFQSPTFIAQQPQSQTAYGTYPVSFSVVAVSPLPLSYQWQFNGGDIQGATGSTLTLSNVQLTNAGTYSVQVTNALISLTSSNAVLTVVFPPPSITVDPTNQTVVMGSNALFSVVAFSPYPMAFQWQRSGTNLTDAGRIAGSTNTSLSITDVQKEDGGLYQVLITNAYGATTSAIVWLTVLAEPVLVAQPSDSVLMALSTASFSVIVTGAPPFSYQWQKDGMNLLDDGRISGAGSAALSIADLQTTDSGRYTVTVTNAFGGAQSTNATLTVVPIVLWGNTGTAVPAAATNLVAIAPGGDFGWGEFNMVLRGDKTVIAWGGGSYGSMPVPASATNVVAIAAGDYHGVALRQDGTVVGWGYTSPPDGISNVVAVAAGVWHALALLQDGTVVGWGDTLPPAGISNIVAISAGGDFSIALQQDGTVIGWGANYYGATTPPASATNVVAIAAGARHSLFLRSDGTLVGSGDVLPPQGISNVVQIASGNDASLALKQDGSLLGWGYNYFGNTTPPPNLTNIVAIGASKEFHSMALVKDQTSHTAPILVQNPSSTRPLVGQTALLMSQANGTLPLSYQWYFNQVPMAGQTNNWLALTSIRTDQAGSYQVVVTNSSGAVTSQVAAVSELAWATIATQPANQAAVVTSNATFTVAMYGLPPFGYQWYFNGAPLSDSAHFNGSATASLTISNVQAADGGGYSVVITNASNAVTSTLATLTVLVPAGITAQPTNQSVLLNSNATFTVLATGTGTLSYQWLEDGTNLGDGGTISGSTTPTLTVSGAQTNDDGSYQAVVSNAYGTSTSSVAALTVYVPVQVTSQPSSKAVLIGSSASFAVTGNGTALGYQWYFNNTPLVDGSRIAGSASSTLTVSNVQGSDAGGYWALVSNLLSSARSMTASLTPLTIVAPSVRYVNVNSTNPAPPYVNWTTAATTIQDAIDAAVDGDLILVADGVYQTGGRVVYGLLTNRVAVNKAVVVRSVNGAAATMIQGGGPAGDSAVRCVYLTNKACVAGFTLASGAVRSAGDLLTEQSGGGAWCESTNSVLLNCLILSNTVAQCGGGVYSGTCSNCYLAFNSATNGGGAFGGVLNYCTLATNAANNGGGGCSNTLNGCSLFANMGTNWGGGAYGSVLNNCTVTGNTNSNLGGGIHSCIASACSLSNNFCSGSYGGGAYNSRLSNCLVLGNTAGQGGGAYNCVMNYCRVSGNVAAGGAGGGGSGGTFNNCLICSNSASGPSGAYQSTLNNCTVVGHTNGYALYGGTARNCISYYNAVNYAGGTLLTSCCTLPLPRGAGNFTNAPMFVDLPGGNFRLQTNSPCINSGDNAYVTNSTDLDGRPRIVAGTVDMGAYEFQGAGAGEFIGWLQQNDLATDGSADFSDPDGDGMNNWQEWIAGTNPTNALSRLLLSTTPVSLGVSVTWPSTSSRTYFIERSTNLAALPAFAILITNVPGQSGTTTYTDSTAIGPGPFFYRVGVQGPAPFWLVQFSRISFAWLQQYGLPTDGSADLTDPDADGMTNWQEWIAGTDPTNPSSVLRMLAASNSLSGITVSWQSVTGRTYYLQRGTNLLAQPGLASLKSNIVGQAGMTRFTDTTATNTGPYFYRVGVQ